MDIKERIPIKSEKAASRIIDKEAVIILLERQESLVLNEVGARIWEIMDGQKTIREIAGIITDEFEVTYDEALKDITEFIDEMVQKEAIFFKQSDVKLGTDTIFNKLI